MNELDRIAAEASAVEAPNDRSAAAGQMPGPPVAAQLPDRAQRVAALGAELEGAAQALLSIVLPVFPPLKELYTPEVVKAATGAIAAVAVKRGWLATGLFGAWGEEISAAIILVPLALQTHHVVTRELAARKVQRKTATSGDGAQRPAPASDAPPAGLPPLMPVAS